MQTCKLPYKESYIECTHHVYPPSPPRKVHGTVEQIAHVVANRWLCLVVSVFPCMQTVYCYSCGHVNSMFLDDVH